jgi:hypothetical protein
LATLAGFVGTPAGQKTLEIAGDLVAPPGAAPRLTLTHSLNLDGKGLRLVAKATMGEKALDNASQGDLRELRVAELFGGFKAQQADRALDAVIRSGDVTARIDVIGTGWVGQVGGSAKGSALETFGHYLTNLKIAAQGNGLQARFYYEKGTAQSVIDKAKAVLGEGNVFEFTMK